MSMLCVAPCLPATARLAAARFEEAATARLTLLEGKVKFLENQLNSSKLQQQPQGPTAAAGSSVLHAGSSSSSRVRSSAAAVAAEAMPAAGVPQQQSTTHR
jgi:hypothetical protein